MRKTIAQLFATSLDCEQALLFWQVKRAAIERASELAGKLVTPPCKWYDRKNKKK